MHETRIKQAAQTIRDAGALLIGAGAGMGVDSGLPDFRGNQGFWNAYPPFRKLGLSFYDLANPQWFHQDPHRAWGFYGHRLRLYRETTPHPGFQILKGWSHSVEQGSFALTSNVDGHFQRAGFEAEEVFEVHGSLNHLQCAQGCHSEIWNNTDEVQVDESTMRADDPLPQCPRCRCPARPNVLMFGDWEWNGARSQSQQLRFERWLQTVDRNRLVVLELGAGTSVPTVRMACESVGGTLIRINLRESGGPQGTVSLSLGALEALNKIEALLG